MGLGGRALQAGSCGGHKFKAAPFLLFSRILLVKEHNSCLRGLKVEAGSVLQNILTIPIAPQLFKALASAHRYVVFLVCLFFVVFPCIPCLWSAAVALSVSRFVGPAGAC